MNAKGKRNEMGDAEEGTGSPGRGKMHGDHLTCLFSHKSLAGKEGLIVLALPQKEIGRVIREGGRKEGYVGREIVCAGGWRKREDM